MFKSSISLFVKNPNINVGPFIYSVNQSPDVIIFQHDDFLTRINFLMHLNTYKNKIIKIIKPHWKNEVSLKETKCLNSYRVRCRTPCIINTNFAEKEAVVYVFHNHILYKEKKMMYKNVQGTLVIDN